MVRSHGTVIVGGSVAAVTAAGELRRLGYDESIVLVSDEDVAPYARPPLSKGVLSGRDSAESIALPPFGPDVELRLSSRATGLRLDRKRVVLSDAEEVPYDQLLIATGARARKLDARGDVGETVLRTVEDCLEIRDRLFRGSPSSVVVIGGGFLGMELASTCRSLGLPVTVVDIEIPLVRQFGPFLGHLLLGAAIEFGVEIRHSPGGVGLLGTRDRAEAVELDDGSQVFGDLVLTAVGCQPNTDWLVGSGLELAGGVVVDDLCRAAPGVTAAGDVACWVSEPNRPPRRTPHYMHAADQARAAATTIVLGDGAAPYRQQPYFWTEQFGLEIKVCGPLPLVGVPRVVEGSLRDRKAILCWYEQGRSTAAVSINYRAPLKKLRGLAWGSLGAVDR